MFKLQLKDFYPHEHRFPTYRRSGTGIIHLTDAVTYRGGGALRVGQTNGKQHNHVGSGLGCRGGVSTTSP